MAYILESIIINRKENKFLADVTAGDTEFNIGFQEWYSGLLQKYIDNGCFIDNKVEITQDRLQNEHGHWLNVRRIGFFKEAHMASNFFRDFNEDPCIYRQVARNWHRDNLITGEINVLNTNEEISVVAASCQKGICDRKSGDQECPTDKDACHGSGTGFNPMAEALKEYHIPLKSFVKFKTK